MNAMDADGGSRKRGLFSDVSQDTMSKIARVNNPEFIAAFRAFDADRSGFIDLAELSAALQAVQQGVQAGSTQAPFFPRPFNASTCCWLGARFGDGSRLSGEQFCELMGYLSNLKNVFEQVDADRSGTIDCGELHRALTLSGTNFDEATVRLIGTSYDSDGNGMLEFDEFVQMRLEWDCYIAAWEATAGLGATVLPEQLAAILEEVKRSLEPVGSLLTVQAQAAALASQGLLFNSMFKVARPFQPQTCQWLIIRFGAGNFCLTFSQFCMMLAFLKEMKTVFAKLDLDRNGSLNLTELVNAFNGLGLPMPAELVMQIGQSFDRDNSGEIDFDEFVQMSVEWNDMCQQQARFSTGASGRIGAVELQELFGHVRVVYRVVNGVVQGMRPFNLNTCRLLAAKFGSPLPGEAFAQGVTWTEFLHLTQHVKEAFLKYSMCDVFGAGSVGTEEFGTALAAFGMSLTREAVENIRRSFDGDGSGRFEFDEFLQVLLEFELYERCFNARAVPGGSGVITLDKSTFFAMVFAVPRNLSS